MLADMKCKYTFFCFVFSVMENFLVQENNFFSNVLLISVVFGKFRRW